MRPTQMSVIRTLAFTGTLAIAGISNVAIAKPIPECGGLDFDAGVTCGLDVTGGCTARCTPINVDASCAVKLTGGCSGMCTAMADVSCSGSCNTQCQADCMANANFDCEASCNSQCTGDCASQCSSSSNSAQCSATCKANCSGKCSGSCMGQASANCMGKCSGCCSGRCTADAELNCQLSCQPPMAYANCEAMVTGGCQADCKSPNGALFCKDDKGNEYYVDLSTTSVDKCLQALLAQFNIKASGYAYGSCQNGTCTGNAGGSVSCATTTPGAGDYALGSLGALSAMGLGLAFMRRRKAKRA